MRVPGGTTAPDDSGTAPTPRSGALPGMAKDETTLWLASDPLLHGVFRATLGNPTMCRAMRAAEIFAPMMLGTVTPGEVVDVVEEVVVEEVGGSVVVRIVRSASFWSADGAPAHDESAQAARTAAAPAAAERIPACTDPSCCVGAAERVPPAATRVTSRY